MNAIHFFVRAERTWMVSGWRIDEPCTFAAISNFHHSVQIDSYRRCSVSLSESFVQVPKKMHLSSLTQHAAPDVDTDLTAVIENWRRQRIKISSHLFSKQVIRLMFLSAGVTGCTGAVGVTLHPCKLKPILLTDKASFHYFVYLLTSAVLRWKL